MVDARMISQLRLQNAKNDKEKKNSQFRCCDTDTMWKEIHLQIQKRTWKQSHGKSPTLSQDRYGYLLKWNLLFVPWPSQLEQLERQQWEAQRPHLH